MFFREWFAVFCVLCFIATLFLAEEFPCKSLFQVGQPAEIQKIQVEILGAVERPGMYEVEVGSSLLELVSRAGLKKTADKEVSNFRERFLIYPWMNRPFSYEGRSIIFIQVCRVTDKVRVGIKSTLIYWEIFMYLVIILER